MRLLICSRAQTGACPFLDKLLICFAKRASPVADTIACTATSPWIREVRSHSATLYSLGLSRAR